VLLDRHRVVGAALDGGVVGDDDALAPAHPADAGDDAGRRHGVVVHAVGGQRRQLEQGRPGVEQPVDAVAHEQLAAVDVPLPGPLVTAEAGRGRPLPQLGDQVGQGWGGRAGGRAGHRGGLLRSTGVSGRSAPYRLPRWTRGTGRRS
jgi:hypothetical protein